MTSCSPEEILTRIDQRLKELESRGMVIRTVLSAGPVAVTYELTDFGRSALSVLEDLRIWSDSNNIAATDSGAQ